MPDVTITIGNFEAQIIQKLANQSNRTPRELVEHKVNSWAMGQFDGYFIKKVNALTSQEKINILGDIE